MNKIKIYLADDHIVLRDGLAALINAFDDCEVVGKAANGKELVADLERGINPELVVLDLNMPVMDGFETAGWLKANRPGIKILVLSMFDSHVAVIRLFQLGVRGMLKKDSGPQMLHDAIRILMQNGYYYGQSGTENLVSFFSKDQNNRSAADNGFLTEEELTYIKLCCSEMTNKEMGSVLKMSAGALENMRTYLWEKLDVKSRVGLVIYAVKNGIINF